VKLEFLESGSPDCPLIRLYGFDIPAALRLRALFRALADESQQHIRLHDQLGIEAIQGCQLDLRVGGRDRGIKQTSPTTFECVLTSEGWAEVADMMGLFVKRGIAANTINGSTKMGTCRSCSRQQVVGKVATQSLDECNGDLSSTTRCGPYVFSVSWRRVKAL